MESCGAQGFQMDTFTYYYLCFFIIIQLFTFLKSYGVLGIPEVSLKNRALASLFNIVRAVVSVWLGFKLLGTLELRVIDSIWIILAVGIFAFFDFIAVRIVENRLLGKPLPTVKDFFS